MVIAFACMMAMGVVAIASLIALYIKTAKIWELEDKLYDMQALLPVRIDEESRWTDWDEGK